MSVVKQEWSGIVQLLRVRLRLETRNVVIFFLLSAGLLAFNLGGVVYAVVRETTAFHHHAVSDFSTGYFFGAGVLFLLSLFTYRQTNAKLSVFPQTGTGRFVSSLLFRHLLMMVIALTTLVMYLVSVGVLGVMRLFRDDLHLTLDIRPGFIAAGFFVFLMYGFLLLAFLELFGTVLRKWHVYAVIVLVTLFAMLVFPAAQAVVNLPRMLAFLIAEPSLLRFFAKAVALWAVFTAAALVLNRYTPNREVAPVDFKRVAVFAVLCWGLGLFAVNLLQFGEFTSNERVTSGGWSMVQEAEEIRFDIAHLPADTRIAVRSNVDTRISVRVHVDLRLPLYIPARGNVLYVHFFPPFMYVDGVDVMRLANPRLTAALVGTTLYIEYLFDPTQVVTVPVWSLARQFDRFRDTGVMRGTWPGSSFSGRWEPNVFVGVE